MFTASAQGPIFSLKAKKKHRLTALSFNKIHQNIVQSGQIIISPYRCDCGLLSFCCSKLLPIFCLSKPAHGIPCSYCSTRPCGFESNLWCAEVTDTSFRVECREITSEFHLAPLIYLYFFLLLLFTTILSCLNLAVWTSNWSQSCKKVVVLSLHILIIT